LSIRALRTLIAVARKGSFAAAAEEVGRTQAAVSLQMKQLEEELEAELFDRSGRTHKLNANGRLALERAEQIIALYDGLPEDIHPHKTVRGVLELGVIHTALTGVFPPVLAKLKKTYDQLEVRIRYGLSATLAKMVEEGELDAGLVSELPHPPPAHCLWRSYDVEQYYVVSPPGTRVVNDAELFESFPYIRFAKHAWSGAVVEGHLLARGIKTHDVMEVDSLEAALSLVEQGLGVAVTPISPVRLERARERFTLVPFGETPLMRSVGLYINKRHTKEALTEPLLAALREECSVK
jgi:DNA-binding transcriptional LysR family regulator